MEKQSIVIKEEWAKAFSRIGMTAIIVVGIAYVMTQCMRTPIVAIKEIANGFNSGKVIEEFHSYVTTVRGSNYLQIATLQSFDTFTRTDSKKIMWERIGLPDVRVELQAPVEYTFYLDLKDKWEFKWQNEEQGVIVIAPKIQSNTPAIDVSKMRIREEGSVLRNEDEVQEKLKQQITEISKTMAQEKISLIRELARNETRQFIESWFIKVYFKDAEIKPHVQRVYFADEVETLEQVEQETLLKKKKEL